MLSVCAGLPPGLFLVLNRSPDPLGTRGALTPCWISVCAPSLLPALASIGHPVLLWPLCLTHHPGLSRPFFFPASLRDPRLVWREVTHWVSARGPDLLLASIPTWGPGLQASVPPGAKALVLGQGLLPAGLWTLDPHILRPQPWRGESHPPRLCPVGKATRRDHGATSAGAGDRFHGRRLDVIVPVSEGILQLLFLCVMS